MSSYVERIAEEWRERAKELAAWTMKSMVNRTDVWGRYLAKKYRTNEQGVLNNAITAPFGDERGKVFLKQSSLEKHYKTRRANGVLGLHSSGGDGTSRWMAIDVDLHDLDNLSVTAEGNFVAAQGWLSELQKMGFDPLLFDSNGQGGYHILVLFAEPMWTTSVFNFLTELVSDFDKRGLDNAPDMFPTKYQRGHYGRWLRLPGLHHTRDHYTRVFNDEPWAEDKWLDGHDAIDRILRTQLAPVELLEKHGVERRRKTVCLDFDGVIHSYTSGWRGATTISDPPIHGVKDAIARLRNSFRIVVHSARCSTEEGAVAVGEWLDRHGIEVDEVCRFKPPAHVYVDDRAIPFTGDWEEVTSAIHAFRR